MQFFDGFFGIWQNGKPTFELEMSQGFFLGGGSYRVCELSTESSIWCLDERAENVLFLEAEIQGVLVVVAHGQLDIEEL